MTLKEAIKRIEELERKVKELEARPQQHYHFYSPPVCIPVIPVQPIYPSWPYQPYTPNPYLPIGPTWTVGAAGQAADNHLTFNA